MPKYRHTIRVFNEDERTEDFRVTLDMNERGWPAVQELLEELHPEAAGRRIQGWTEKCPNK
jgi:hypothetical protein